MCVATRTLLSITNARSVVRTYGELQFIIINVRRWSQSKQGKYHVALVFIMNTECQKSVHRSSERIKLRMREKCFVCMQQQNMHASAIFALFSGDDATNVIQIHEASTAQCIVFC